MRFWNKFHMAFQKRIEYKILFSYVKGIMDFLGKNLEEFKEAGIKEREEPTVKQFREIHSIFTAMQKDEQTEKGKIAGGV